MVYSFIYFTHIWVGVGKKKKKTGGGVVALYWDTRNTYIKICPEVTWQLWMWTAGNISF